MKKVLFLTYFYAPYNNTGSFRITRFIKYLSKNDIEPFIITAKHKNLPISDHYKKDIPDSATVIRKPVIFDKNKSYANEFTYNPKNRSFVKQTKLFIKDLFLSPDIHILWSLSVVHSAYKVINKENIKYIFVNGGPFSLFVAGLIIKILTGVKLILDFRDPWSTNPNQLNQSWVRKIHNNFWELLCLKNSYAVISVNESIIGDLQNRCPNGRYLSISNSIDFTEYSDFIKEKIDSDKFIFGYAGKFNVHDDSYNPTKLLLSFKDFITIYNHEKKILLRVFGEINHMTQKFIDDLDLNDSLELMGYCMKQDVIKGLSQCDAFIQFYYPNKFNDALSIKMFDYTYFRKPIISINTKNGILSDYIENSRIGYFCENDNVQEIIQNFQKVYTLDLQNFNDNINEKYLEQYSIKKQIADLIEILR